MKRMLVVLGLAACVVALAADNVVGAKGLGAATNTSGQRWCFSLDSHRTGAGTAAVFGGPSRLRREVMEHDHKMVNDIYLGAPTELVKSGNVVTYAGNGRRRLTQDGVLVREDWGRFYIKATDRRAAGATTGEPDLLSWSFTAPNLPVLSFAGAVSTGDLVVYEHPL